MIFNFTDTTRFYLFSAPIDMRKGIHSLYHLVESCAKMEALNGDGYVFIGKTRKAIKILRWQKEGFVLYHKKLELGRFSLSLQQEDASFSEVEGEVIDKMVSFIKHRSSCNELRRKVLATL